MTVEIINMHDHIFSRVSVSMDEIDDMLECAFVVNNDKHPTQSVNDNRWVMIELCHYTKNQDFTEPNTWSWNIIYNAHGDNHYLCDSDVCPNANDIFTGSRYKDIESAVNDAVDTYEGNIGVIKMFIEQIDDMVLGGN